MRLQLGKKKVKKGSAIFEVYIIFNIKFSSAWFSRRVNATNIKTWLSSFRSCFCIFTDVSRSVAWGTFQSCVIKKMKKMKETSRGSLINWHNLFQSENVSEPYVCHLCANCTFLSPSWWWREAAMLIVSTGGRYRAVDYFMAPLSSVCFITPLIHSDQACWIEKSATWLEPHPPCTSACFWLDRAVWFVRFFVYSACGPSFLLKSSQCRASWPMVQKFSAKHSTSWFPFREKNKTNNSKQRNMGKQIC